MFELSSLRFSVESYIHSVSAMVADVEAAHAALNRCQIPDWKGQAKRRYDAARDEASQTMYRTQQSLHDLLACASAALRAIEDQHVRQVSGLDLTGVR